MRGPFRSRSFLSVWLAPLCVAAWLLMPASAGAISSAGCNARANATVKKLGGGGQTGDLWQHMQAFWQIAQDNPGPDGHPSRNSGEPGYRASVDYVAGLMRQAGYNVTVQTFTFDYFSFVGTPQFSESSPTAHDFALNTEWDPGRSTGPTTTAQVQTAAGI